MGADLPSNRFSPLKHLSLLLMYGCVGQTFQHLRDFEDLVCKLNETELSTLGFAAINGDEALWIVQPEY